MMRFSFLKMKVVPWVMPLLLLAAGGVAVGEFRVFTKDGRRAVK